MGWDPAVLRKYNTTGHFRLINQLRSELKGNPLIRPKAGETVGAANRSKSLTRALQNRLASGAGQRSRRSVAAAGTTLASQPAAPLVITAAGPASGGMESFESAQARSFRERLNAIEMR